MNLFQTHQFRGGRVCGPYLSIAGAQGRCGPLNCAGPARSTYRQQGRHIGAGARGVCAAARPNGRPGRRSSNLHATTTASEEVAAAEEALYAAISGVKGRGAEISPEKQAKLEAAIAVLEEDGGVPDPTASPTINGNWKLLFTTRPGSASPIQRTFTGVDAFTVQQNLDLARPEGAIVDNVVTFGSAGRLKVQAEAITDSRPKEGFVPRQGKGLALFGESANYPPARPNLRIDFAFDNADFDFKLLPFRIPYPVPFRLLGDETRGWIDVTYLAHDGQLRLARGNKGTLFILERMDPVTYVGTPQERLLAAVAAQDDPAVAAAIEELSGTSAEAIPEPATSPQALGVWRQVWSKQAADANRFQSALSGLASVYQIIKPEGVLVNLVELLPILRLRAEAGCSGEGSKTYVAIEGLTANVELGPWVLDKKLGIQLGPWKKEVNVKDSGSGRGWVEWLYLDDNLRITRGNKGSTFIHVRAAPAAP